jgi:hypothetical protein
VVLRPVSFPKWCELPSALNVHTTDMLFERTWKTAFILCFSLSSMSLLAKGKHPKSAPPPPQDQIQVAAHIPLTGDRIVRFLTTQHYRRNYLYAEHASGKTVTLIDITKIDRPAMLSEIQYPEGLADDLVAVTGNAALVAAGNTRMEPQSTPQAFRILSFADPLHPTVQQQFDGVTAIARDERRGLIFLANADGVWILQQRFAMDPEDVKEWEHMMLDNR